MPGSGSFHGPSSRSKPKLSPSLHTYLPNNFLLLKLQSLSLCIHADPRHLKLSTANTQATSKMACGSSKCLYDRSGPGSAATSIAESIIKPSEATGTKTKCIECGDYECCCIPCTIL
ncbi:hypothetical protein FPOAC2_08236 [Fusarium poae]|uniref:Uncharacterized protein n=1 Tax=Fusarium poae TaxID=36050 RepID=A0A1B8AKV2_FUSPO|nr:hypothetical protein FPOAC1_008315 [Fusarium poae]KAG8668931.1 hypothetical protein FPOAC1_008315 [Fusarium poae]OBS21163.1 hypothetical protein FPOA_07501 [Fusarium poae]